MTTPINTPTPPEMVESTVAAMQAKATTSSLRTFLLALPGGGLIALGFAFFVNTQLGAADVPAGLIKLIGGMTFSVGLMMVVLTGAELFTSTTMSLSAKLAGRITWGQWIRHWVLSYVGNFVGAMLVVGLCYFGRLQDRNGGAWGEIVSKTAAAKVSYPWMEAFVLGIGANFFVCIAVFMAFSGRTTTDKILAVIGPITAFVALGFEHSVANMFMIPFGIILGDNPALTWSNFIFANLIPVTLGNIIGGGVAVGLFQWFIHQKLGAKPAQTDTAASSKVAR